MRVLDPSFDTAFKYLMQDIDIARDLISLIIEETIVKLYPAPQETTSTQLNIKFSTLALQHLDYVAIIETIDSDGKPLHQKVMIELQKSPFKPEISRFRLYLAEKYRTKSSVPPPKAKPATKETPETTEEDLRFLPIKTIYLIEETFNDKLPSILKRTGLYYNVLDKNYYEGKRDEFVELLNHDSWFIQLKLVQHDLQQRIVQVLSVFTGWYRDPGDLRFIDYPDENLREMKDKLLHRILKRMLAAAGDEKLKLEVTLELEYENYYEKMLKETAEAQQREAEARQKLISIVKKLHEKGMSNGDIAELTGETVENLNSILSMK